MSKAQKLQSEPSSCVGEIVLLKIHEEPLTYRPLLVVSDNPEGVVSGELFLNFEEDTQCAWVRENMFYMPHKDLRATPVHGIIRGGALGQWRKKK